jgi:hypothetical protein
MENEVVRRLAVSPIAWLGDFGVNAEFPQINDLRCFIGEDINYVIQRVNTLAV